MIHEKMTGEVVELKKSRRVERREVAKRRREKTTIFQQVEGDGLATGLYCAGWSL